MDFDFKEYMENVRDTLKKVPRWAWFAIAGGIVLLYVVSRETYTEPGIVSATQSTGGGSPVGLGGGDPQSLSAGTDGVVSKLNDDIKAVVSDNKQLNTDFNRVSREFESYQTNTNKVIAETEKNFNTLSEAYAFETALNNVGSIYNDSKDDATQYSSLFATLGTDQKVKTEQKERALDKVAGLGNNGVVDKTASNSLSLAQIKGDKTILDAEIDRTNRVIENRKDAGLDTSLQQKWLNQLTPTTTSNKKTSIGEYRPMA